MEDFGLGWAVVGIGLTALVTTVGTWFVTRYQLSRQAEIERAARKEELDRTATYLAVRVSSVLDPFVTGCVAVINDSGLPDQQGEMYPEERTPTLDLPQDVDWKSIDPHLMDRILSLPNEMARAEDTIAFVGDMISGPPDHSEWFAERRYQWAKLGLMAMDLARDLRDRYKLLQRDYSIYDPREVLERAFRKEDGMRKKGAVTAKRIVANGKKKQASGR
jgi:hypothetical protein